MAGMAVAMVILISVAIYSLSRLSSAPWTSILRTPDIQAAGDVHPLPNFEVISGNKPFTPANLEGHWTLLTFWSYSCPPCIEEMPALNALALNWQGPEFSIVTVNWDQAEDLEAAKRFMQEQQIALPTIYDQDEVMKKAFGVTEYPRHFLISPDKKIVWQALGAYRWNDQAARDQLLKLMEQQSPEADQDPSE